MNILLLLIPVALVLGGLGLLAFIWSARSGQFDDLDGAAMRVLIESERPEKPGTDQSGPAPVAGEKPPDKEV